MGRGVGRGEVGGGVGVQQPDGRLITLSLFYTWERPGKCVCALGIPKTGSFKRYESATKAF